MKPICVYCFIRYICRVRSDKSNSYGISGFQLGMLRFGKNFTVKFTTKTLPDKHQVRDLL